MCDSVLYSTTLVVSAEITKGFNFTRRPRNEFLGIGAPPAYLHTPSICFGNPKLNLRTTRNLNSFVDPEESKFYGEIELLKEKIEEEEEEEEEDNTKEVDGIGDFKLKPQVEDFLRNGDVVEEDIVPVEESSSKGASLKFWRGRQVMKRSNLIAKQVISIISARTLGFVSQLWVDTNSWVVLVLEVRPNLLSGESDRIHLEDVSQVGDVVLVENESILENEIRMAGLETLVGYKVVTPDRRNIGKVRGYSFNINSGAVESLELDSFGVSIIPSSLVSTYALLVEDVLEVFSDTVIVHEAAASHIQRLTKGFWGNKTAETPVDGGGEYSDDERPVRYKRGRKFPKKRREIDIELELPMDYL